MTKDEVIQQIRITKSKKRKRDLQRHLEKIRIAAKTKGAPREIRPRTRCSRER